MGYDVFISYSTKDKAAADAVCAALEANGVRCWVAPRDIKPGENWATSILRAIADSRMMVLVFSAHANDSQHIRREVERAVHRGIPIAPLRIEDVMPKDDMEYFLSSSHWMDALTPPLTKHLREFTQKVRGLLEVGGEPPGAAPDLSSAVAERQTPAAPAPRRGRVAMLLAVVLLAGLAAAAWAFRGELARRFADVAPKEPAGRGSAVVPLPAVVPASVPASAPAIVSPAPATVAAVPAPGRQQPLAALKDLFLADRITAEQYQLGQVLLKADPAALDDYDSSRRAQFTAVLDGKLAPDKLAPALSAIESPQAKAARLAREQAQGKEALRQNRIAGLLASARADQSPEKGVEGLALVEQVLALDPSNADALGLKAKITSLMADADRTKQEQQRHQRVAWLLQQARDCDSPEKGQTALALLADLLKLDPANPDALRLKQRVEFYFAKNCVNTIGMKFTRIEPGEFLMGSPAGEDGRFDDETQHKVKLTKPFFMGTHHVTRGQFAAFLKDAGYKTDAEKDGWAYAWTGTTYGKVDGACWLKPGFDQTDEHPVVEVSWNDAQAFCQWLSKKEGGKYRLPTEAEWEYACRSGTHTAYFWGDTPDGGQGFANCADLTAKDKFPNWTTFNWRDGFVYTSPVGSFKPNLWGLYDMIGNAFEWCGDFYGPYPDGDATDPTGPAQGDISSSRVLRGGSWSDDPRVCRAAYRGRNAPGYRSYNFGFRVCLDF
jgi:sulfatase modifying factor 1